MKKAIPLSTTRRSTRRVKGVFCLECDWWGTLRKQSSLEPVLQLLKQWHPHYVPYIHRNTATRGALEHYLNKWLQRAYRDYSILYLALHGGGGDIYFGDGRKTDGWASFEWLEDQLQGKCHGRIIHLAGCESMDIHGKRLNSFLRTTGALAVCGYRGWVDWLRAAAFDLLVLAAMQDNALTVAGAKAMHRRIRENQGLAKDLGFRMVVRQ